MKNCPYCAEKIQNDAIVCRYCGKDTRVPVPAPDGQSRTGSGEPLPSPEGNKSNAAASIINETMTSIVAWDKSWSENKAREEANANRFKAEAADLDGRITAFYARHIVPGSRSAQHYPLGTNRRPGLIAALVCSVAYHVEHLGITLGSLPGDTAEKRQETEGLIGRMGHATLFLLAMNWKNWTSDWRKAAEIQCGEAPYPLEMPTEEEWLSALALVLVKALNRGANLRVIDFVGQWRQFDKAARLDRIFRGFSLVGSIMNLSEIFNPKRCPDSGSTEWYVLRRAAAQAEAMAIEARA